MFLINKINPLVFFISFCIGLFLTYIFTPLPDVIIKYPTPENSNSLIYRDEADNCYKFRSLQVKCPKNPKLIPVHL